MNHIDFDKDFDEGKNIDKHLDWSKARRPALKSKRVNIDFPSWMVNSLDQESSRLGITRQSLIKMWLADRIEGVGQ